MITEFVVGDWYRLETWGELIKKYPLSENPDKIEVPGVYYYTKEMEALLSDRSRIFQAQSTESHWPFPGSGWSVSPQMCDPIGKEILEEIMGDL